MSDPSLPLIRITELPLAREFGYIPGSRAFTDFDTEY